MSTTIDPKATGAATQHPEIDGAGVAPQSQVWRTICTVLKPVASMKLTVVRRHLRRRPSGPRCRLDSFRRRCGPSLPGIRNWKSA